jgi:hypothetical protein
VNIFLTPVMHFETANNFKIVERNLELTARSVCGQTDQDFLFVIACNHKP